MRKRVIVYIDGFNLYFGIKEKRWERFAWLDLTLFAKNLLKPGQELIAVHYFTSRLSGQGPQSSRQISLLEANEVSSQCAFHFGHYQTTSRVCPRCGFPDEKPSEKMTDVNIATRLLADAFDDRYDTALLVSGDSDLAPAVEEVKRRFADKRVVLAFPPCRFSNRLATLGNGFLRIGRGKLSSSQLSDQIVKAEGTVLRRPEGWR